MAMAGYCSSGLKPLPSGTGVIELIHRQHLKGIGDEIIHQQEESLHRRQHRHHVRHHVAVLAAVGEDHHGGVGGQQPAPEQQRAFLPAPPGGELIDRGQGAVAVLGHVGEAEIAGQQGMHQDADARVMRTQTE